MDRMALSLIGSHFAPKADNDKQSFAVRRLAAYLRLGFCLPVQKKTEKGGTAAISGSHKRMCTARVGDKSPGSKR